MSPTTPSRDRVLDAALDCFAAKGFKATTIVDIETAAGLSPGAGGTYRHFRSKRHMLEAAIERAVQGVDEQLAPIPTSMAGAARDGIELFTRNKAILRMLFTDLEEFPELRQKMLDHFLDVYRLAAERTAVISPAGDAEALAVMVSGAMLAFGLLDSVLGVRALDVDEERFAQAWARVLDLVIADELACAAQDEENASEKDPS